VFALAGQTYAGQICSATSALIRGPPWIDAQNRLVFRQASTYQLLFDCNSADDNKKRLQANLEKALKIDSG
jgi:hypothetical protein